MIPRTLGPLAALVPLVWTGLALAEEAAPTQAHEEAEAHAEKRFVPELTVITAFSLAGANVDDPTAEALALPGFLDVTARQGKLQGIHFDYLELALNACVDPYFDFFGVVAFSPEEVGVEEAYIDSRPLPLGFQVRLGKLLSSFGQQNGKHKHYWDFFEMPLVYEGLVGGEGLSNPGLRLSWTAPVDFLLQLNAEVYQGVFDESPTFDATGYELTAVDGTTLSSSAPFVPGLFVGSIKASFDAGDHVFLLGASAMYGHSTQTRLNGESTDQAFSAPGTVLYGADLTYRYLLGPNRGLTWQSEYLGRYSSGDLALASDGRLHHALKRQGGLYSQLVWRFDEPGQWRAGARFDLITQNSITVDGAGLDLDTMLQRYAAMLEYSLTEFARFRLQYAFDRSRHLAGARRDVHEVLLQVNVALGRHDAHAH